MITIITIIAIAASVAAAIFATLYTTRPEGKAAMDRMNDAQQEIGRLKQSLSDISELLAPVTPERIVDYLRNEKQLEAGIDESDQSKAVWLSRNGETYQIFTSRLPQVILMKAYDMSESTVDWNALRQAAWMTTMDLIMVKINIDEESKSYSMYVISHEWDMNDFGHSMDSEFIILKDAETDMRLHYHELLDKKKNEEAVAAPSPDTHETTLVS